jgi:hypothetical protein
MPLANGKIFIGSAGGVATQQTMSGDCTLAASGAVRRTMNCGSGQHVQAITVAIDLYAEKRWATATTF